MSGFNFDAFNRFFGENYKNNKQFLEVLNEYGVNVKEDAIKKWRQGNAAPKTKDIPGIAKALGVTEQDLFDPSQRERIAREEIKKAPMRYALDLPEIQLLQDMVRLPFVTVGAGAEAMINVELLESIYIPKELLPVNIDLKNTIIGKILGDSMEPKYRENDIVFFDMVNGRDVILPDAIYLVRYGDTVQIKQVQFLGNGDIRVISFNENYPPIQPVNDLGVDWEILGKPFLHWHAEISSRLQEKE